MNGRIGPMLALVSMTLSSWLASDSLAQPTPAGVEFQANSYTTGGQGPFPAVAMDADGDFVAAWRSSGQDGDVSGVFAQRFDSSGARQGVEFQVNTYTPYSQGGANATGGFVAMEGNGDFVVVWPSHGEDGDGRGIFGQRFASSGAPVGGEFQVNVQTLGNQDDAAVAMDADGDFVVVWQDETPNQVVVRVFDSSGAPVTGELYANSGTFSAGGGRVAMADDGDFVVAWSDGREVPSIVVAQRFDASGTRLGSELELGNGGSTVAVDADGDFLIAWSSGAGIVGQRFDSAGAPAGAELQVSADGGRPRAAMSSGGSFVVAWEAGPYSDVFVRSFTAAGVADGSALMVNTYTTGSQNEVAVAMDDGGDFVVIWSSSGQDGSNDGVFGQRFAGSGGGGAIDVAIDIEPKSFPNKINLKKGGWATVAILTTSLADGDAADFDAFDVDPSTVVFGPAAAAADALFHAQDVDGDGDLDMTLRFRIQSTGIACGDTSASLRGETFGGDLVEGSDSVLTSNC